MKPGYVGGRHFTTYVERVKDLKASEDYDAAEALLLRLIAATEAESDGDGSTTAPWYTEQLAIIRRKRKDHAGEVEILERADRWDAAHGFTGGRFADRLTKARALLEKARRRTDA